MPGGKALALGLQDRLKNQNSHTISAGTSLKIEKCCDGGDKIILKFNLFFRIALQKEFAIVKWF